MTSDRHHRDHRRHHHRRHLHDRRHHHRRHLHDRRHRDDHRHHRRHLLVLPGLALDFLDLDPYPQRRTNQLDVLPAYSRSYPVQDPY